MAERFATWVATQHVHTFDGDHIGDIRVRRLTEQLGPGRVRVTCECTPTASLTGHAMARFDGEWVFEAETSGPRLRHHGPDLLGQETQWMLGATTGRGLWPRLGFGWSSWSIDMNPERVVSGGWFDVAGRPVAAVVAVAVPETEGTTAPSLDLAAQPALDGLDDGFAAVQHRVGPLVVVEGWQGAEHFERRLVIADGALGVTACLAVSEVGGTRTGELTFGPVR